MFTNCGEIRMNKQAKFQLIISGVLFAFFILLLILLLTVDVRPIAADGSNVGLASINKAIADAIGFNGGWKKLTDVLMMMTMLEAVVFAGLGVFQGIKRKSLKEIDYTFIALAITYLTMVFLYIFFELVVINRRPILDEGKAEASFPSTHVLIILGIAGTGITEINRLVKNKPIRICANILTYAVMILAVVGRLLSGVHWFTDILAAIFLSQAIVAAYNGVNVILTEKNKPETKNETAPPEIPENADAVNE